VAYFPVDLVPDYVYIPLGGSKKSEFMGHVNMWLTMVISGLWHGAAFHFLTWARSCLVPEFRATHPMV